MLRPLGSARRGRSPLLQVQVPERGGECGSYVGAVARLALLGHLAAPERAGRKRGSRGLRGRELASPSQVPGRVELACGPDELAQVLQAIFSFGTFEPQPILVAGIRKDDL